MARHLLMMNPFQLFSDLPSLFPFSMFCPGSPSNCVASLLACWLLGHVFKCLSKRGDLKKKLTSGPRSTQSLNLYHETLWKIDSQILHHHHTLLQHLGWTRICLLSSLFISLHKWQASFKFITSVYGYAECKPNKDCLQTHQTQNAVCHELYCSV